MRIVVLFDGSGIYCAACFNADEVTEDLLARLKRAAGGLGLKVHVGAPDWPKLAALVEDLEEEAGSVLDGVPR